MYEYCIFQQKATLIPGGSESLVYATVTGTIGVLVPFNAHEEQDFFQHLEMHMRSENPPLCGRDHLSYRSYYFPVKVSNLKIYTMLHLNIDTLIFYFQNVCDGDLCEQYNSIDITKQKSIAADLDKTPAEVSKRLEDIRTRYAF